MRHFVLLLAHFLFGFASRDILTVPAQSLPRNLVESEMAVVAPVHIDGNRTLQAVSGEYVADEERLPVTELVEPLLEKSEQGLAKAMHIHAMMKGAKSYSMQLAESVLRPFKGRDKSWTLKKVYEQQQILLASTPENERYDKVMLLGHSPFTMKGLFNVRSTILPLSEQLDEEAYFVHINQFITHFQAAISHGEEGSKSGPPTWQKTYESLEGLHKYYARDLSESEEMVIAGSFSARELISFGVNHITYLRLLIIKGDIKPPNEGVVIKDMIKNTKTALSERGEINREVTASHYRVELFNLFVEDFERGLLALKEKVA